MLAERWNHYVHGTMDKFRRGDRTAADLVDPWLHRDRHRLLRLTDPVTWVQRDRRRRLLALMEGLDGERVPGDVVELGVYRGGTAAVLGRACAASPLDRRLWLFDSFEGLPAPGPEDGEEAARFAGGRADASLEPIAARIGNAELACVGTREQVEGFLLGPAGLDRSRVEFVQGWYQDTLPHAEVGQVALLHVDCDWYAGVKLALDTLYDSVVPGGWVVIDDYGDWPGAARALHEFLGSRSIEAPLERVGHTQASFRKP
ncbi:MAG: O-methyltransferase [Thermoleophilaceae bacterium]|nr:O-methyltransferase [Thermoleophilaceae bacterium]